MDSRISSLEKGRPADCSGRLEKETAVKTNESDKGKKEDLFVDAFATTDASAEKPDESSQEEDVLANDTNKQKGESK